MDKLKRLEFLSETLDPRGNYKNLFDKQHSRVREYVAVANPIEGLLLRMFLDSTSVQDYHSHVMDLLGRIRQVEDRIAKETKICDITI